MGRKLFTSLFLYLSLTLSLHANAAHKPNGHVPDFPSCDPVSEFVDDSSSLEFDSNADLGFCADWNPDFPYNGHHCCSKVARTRSRRRGRLGAKICPAERFKPSFCDELTAEQELYEKDVSSGRIPDVLHLITEEMGRAGDQSHCSPNNGFLYSGRAIVPTSANRIQLRAPDRCSNFGNDVMVGMIEWLGRQVAKRFAEPPFEKTHLIVGDVSSPHGGCLAGVTSRKGHASHTTGQDADIGFLTPLKEHDSPVQFHKSFDAASNWWMIKEVLKNPYACVKVIFLDKHLIKKLAKQASKEGEAAEWQKYWRFIRHMPGHTNHIHVRGGKFPGQPGCVADAKPELEEEDDNGNIDTDPEDLEIQGPEDLEI